jgi:hypothetical protein
MQAAGRPDDSEGTASLVHARGHGHSRAGTRWTRALVAYGLDRFHRTHLRTPTQRELRRGIDDLPSYATIQRMYGSVGAMYRAHGYIVRSRGGSRSTLTLDRDNRGRFLPRDLNARRPGGAAPERAVPAGPLKAADRAELHR